MLGLLLSVAAIGLLVAVGMMMSEPEFAVPGYGADDAAASAEPGECFDGLDLIDSRAASVSCDQPHDLEVYARRPAVESPDAAHPERDDLELLSDSLCLAEFEPYVGTSYWDSEELGYVAHAPSSAAWDAGERDVVCALYDWDEQPLVGSSEGSGR